MLRFYIGRPLVSMQGNTTYTPPYVCRENTRKRARESRIKDIRMKADTKLIEINRNYRQKKIYIQNYLQE